MVQGHLPPGGPSPASSLLKVNQSFKNIELHSSMYQTYIGIGIWVVPVGGEVSDWSGILIDLSVK